MAHFLLFCHCYFNLSPIALKRCYTTKQPFIYNIILIHESSLLQKKITNVLKGLFFVSLFPMHGAQCLGLWGTMDHSIII